MDKVRITRRCDQAQFRQCFMGVAGRDVRHFVDVPEQKPCVLKKKIQPNDRVWSNCRSKRRKRERQREMHDRAQKWMVVQIRVSFGFPNSKVRIIGFPTRTTVLTDTHMFTYMHTSVHMLYTCI